MQVATATVAKCARWICGQLPCILPQGKTALSRHRTLIIKGAPRSLAFGPCTHPPHPDCRNPQYSSSSSRNIRLPRGLWRFSGRLLTSVAILLLLLVLTLLLMVPLVYRWASSPDAIISVATCAADLPDAFADVSP